MKKFLSLALALIMTLSLVTISAGATEYKDLTDKDEIQYEEAVAVLNRIGVITGYDDGSFQPTRELTRGAAAKIIVSLLIGPEAANNLPNNSSPYPDVPANYTFAGVISFCKTKNIISGYGDGTFKPGDSLTGYAFAKMLLGAVGYDAEIERFTGSGWTNNIAAIGQSAGLFDRLKFDGSAAVNREQACQLALNALKATVVTYTNGINVNVTGENTNVAVSGGQVRSYKTSNQEFARNIRTRNYTEVASSDNYYTVEFAEEHFVDLRLEHDKWNPTPDDFGRPSAEWSYKKVTIGTYPLEPDFSFNTQVAHIEVTDSAKVRALGLRGYELTDDRGGDNATLWLNGVGSDKILESVGQIADYTDNGTVVEVYVDENDADHITDVVVVRTQLMEVKRVGSDYVSLDRIGQDNEESATTAQGIQGFNHAALNEKTIKNVNVDDACYDVLSALKAGDEVAIIPVSTDGGRTWEAARAYVPETVSGRLSKVTTYGAIGTEPNAVDITVGGTTYKIANWNKDMHDLTADKIKVTTKDVTLVLDEFGNALRAKDVGATSDYMVVGSWAQSLQNGRIIWLAEGWDGKGNAVSLNVGTSKPSAIVPGDLVYYTNENTSGVAEWTLSDTEVREDNKYFGVFDVDDTADTGAYEIKASNVRVNFKDTGTHFTDDNAYFARDVKFIYVDQETRGEDVDTIEIFTGAQAVSNNDLKKTFMVGGPTGGPAVPNANQAQIYMNKDGYVEAVVIKTASNSAQTGNLIYIVDYDATHEYNAENGTKYYGYLVAMMTPDGKIEEKTICSTRNLKRGDFATYTKATDEQAPLPDEFYNLRYYDSQLKTTSVITAEVDRILSSGYNAQKDSKDLMFLKNIKNMSGDSLTRDTDCAIIGNSNILNTTGTEANLVRVLKNANWVDVTAQGWDIGSLDELSDYDNITLALVFNDNVDSDGFRTVSTVVVIAATSTKNSVQAPTVPDTLPSTGLSSVQIEAAGTSDGAQVNKNDVITIDSTILNADSYDRVSYQWQKQDAEGNWVNVPGATNASFTVPTDEAGKTSYRCAVTVRDNSKDDVKEKTFVSDVLTFDVANETAVEAKQATVTVNVTGDAVENAIITLKGTEIVGTANTVLADALERMTLTIESLNGDDLDTNVAIAADPSGTGARVIGAATAKSLTVQAGPADADGKGVDFTIDVTVNAVREAPEFNYRTFTNGIARANLADGNTNGGVPTDDLMNGYAVSGAMDGDTLVITVTHTGLKKHQMGESPNLVGYWVGAFIPTTVGDWTLTAENRDGTDNEVTADQLWEGKLRRYAQAINVESGVNNGSRYDTGRTLVFTTEAGDELRIPYVWDMSGVVNGDTQQG